MGVGALLAAAVAWPHFLCALTDALRSPYERALSSAWCGGAASANVEFFGHCAACWSGALALALAAALIALDERDALVSVR
jgi:hypothetical protein